MLNLDSITQAYRRKNGNPVMALDSVSLSVRPGELVILQGPSGSGKTTLLLTAGGLLPPTSGAVKLQERDIYSLPAGELARVRAKKIGFVFQQFHLIPYLNVLENVLAPSLACPDTGARERALSLLEELGLERRAGHFPSELSTGERQRTALARALLNQPPLILADEPTGNLDRDNSRIVTGHLCRFVSSGGSVLMVTHGPDGLSCAHRRVDIEEGKIVSAD